MPKYIKLGDAAREIGVTRWTLRRWCREGHRLHCPPAIKAGSKATNVLLINRMEWEAFKARLERDAMREEDKQKLRQQVAS